MIDDEYCEDCDGSGYIGDPEGSYFSVCKSCNGKGKRNKMNDTKEKLNER